jgi:hypothetical protein
MVLTRVLDFIVDHHDDPKLVLPENFYHGWWAVSEKFCDQMPTLAEVTLPAITSWLAQESNARLISDPDGLAPTPEAVEQDWVMTAVNTLQGLVTVWLHDALRDPTIGRGPVAGNSPEVEQERQALLELLRRNVPRVDDSTALDLLSTISGVASLPSRGYFVALEHNQNVSEAIRQKAAGCRLEAECHAADLGVEKPTK